jgi:hypothetical protein
MLSNDVDDGDSPALVTDQVKANAVPVMLYLKLQLVSK